jgi:hypothetical protein
MEKRIKIGKKTFVKKIEYVVFENGELLYKTSNKAVFVAHKLKAIKDLFKFHR